VLSPTNGVYTDIRSGNQRVLFERLKMREIGLPA
jgi:hypothetical protein